MKYYPLAVIDRMKEQNLIQMIFKMLESYNINIDEYTLDELKEYVFSFYFFSPKYDGKFKELNYEMICNTRLNKLLFPMHKMEDLATRRTEWKDMFCIDLILSEWEKFKMVYKIDNDFFHTIKNTETILTTYDMFKSLPFKTFFIDLTEVKEIGEFQGAWVHIVFDKEERVCVNIQMVSGLEFMFFSYYSWYDFSFEKSVEWKQDDLPESNFMAFMLDGDIEDGNYPFRYDRYAEKDPRNEIVISIFQIMSFIAMDASDVSENSNTKQTYKPSKTIKNKFSEVKMYDVGIHYGKAIRIAKKEFEKRLRDEELHNPNHIGNYKYNRKPVRPHIRRAHWHTYRVGKGRKETKVNWIAPVYVSSSGEIPVTIRKIIKE